VRRAKVHRIILYVVNPTTGSYCETAFLPNDEPMSYQDGKSTASFYSAQWGFPIVNWRPNHYLPEHVAAQKLNISVANLRKLMEAAHLKTSAVTEDIVLYRKCELNAIEKTCALELQLLQDTP